MQKLLLTASIHLYCWHMKTYHYLLLIILSSFSLFSLANDCNDLYTQSLTPKESLEHKKLISTAKSNWKNLEPQIYWRNWIDDEILYKRFINPVFYESQRPHKHAMEMYKNIFKQYIAFKAGNNFLNSIPVGEFNLTTDLIKELHKVVMKGVYRVDEKFLDFIIPGNLFVAKAGEFKGHTNFGFNPLTRNPLTESQYQAIKDNPAIKFLELPLLSKKDARRGLMVFPGRKKVKEEIENLVNWYNTNKGKVDPIYLAAVFQRRFVSLHPFYNGNGRTSRLLMNRILLEEGLPPALIEDQNLDTYINNDPLKSDELEWTKIVASSVQNYLKQASKLKSKFGTRKLYKQAPFIANKDHGTFLTEDMIKKVEKINVNLFPGRANSEFQVGQERFLLFQDGFFYSNKGVPYVLKEKTFYPIADKTYLLYGMNGKLNSDNLTRNYTSEHENIFTEHLNFLNSLADKNIKLSDYKIEPYSIIEKANNENSYLLYPWQKDLFKKAIDLGDFPPHAILSPNRGGFTSFEQASHKEHRVNISTVVAQYQRMDLQFRHYEIFAKKNAPELLNLIEDNRAKLHKAGRFYIDEFYNRLAKLPEAQQSFYRNHPEYKVFEEYLKFTPLYFEDFSAASEEFKNNIYLLRSDLEFSQKAGFFTENQAATLLERLPWSDKFIPSLRKKYAEYPKKSWQGMLYDKILINQYEYRGVDPEFNRSLVDFYLHSINEGRKTYVSFSTRADQYINESGKFAFSGISDKNYLLHIVKVPISKAHDNYASGWFRQYEILTKGFTPPWKIQKTFKPEDFSNLLPELNSLTTEQKKWMKEYQDLRLFDLGTGGK